MRALLIFLFCLCFSQCTYCPAQECAPLTLTTLSRLAGHSVPFPVWRRLLMPDNQPPDTETAMIWWYQLEPYIDFHVLYRPDSPLPFHPSPDQLYLTVIQSPDAWVARTEPDLHLCLVHFTDHVTLIHTLDTDDHLQGYLIEQMSRTEYDRLVVFLFEVIPASPLVLRWKSLED